MGRLTYKNPDGTWGLNNGYDIKKVPRELYGALCKLKDYEETGLDPDKAEELDGMYLENCWEINELKKQVEELQLAAGQWIPCGERFPETADYILVSFENFDLIDIGRYEEDEEGGAFYPGDAKESYASLGLFVNAWQPVLKPYREEVMK